MARLHALVTPAAPDNEELSAVVSGDQPDAFQYGAALHLPFIIVASAAFAAGVVVAGLSSVEGKGPPWWFFIGWLAAIAWLGYWGWGRLSYRVEVVDGRLRWRLPLRRGGVAAVADVVRLRPAMMDLAGGFEVIELADGTKVLVLAHRGLREFGDALGAVKQKPVPVNIGLQARLSERIGLMSWFRPIST
jgi:hypothetical protein